MYDFFFFFLTGQELNKFFCCHFLRGILLHDDGGEHWQANYKDIGVKENPPLSPGRRLGKLTSSFYLSPSALTE